MVCLLKGDIYMLKYTYSLFSFLFFVYFFPFNIAYAQEAVERTTIQLNSNVPVDAVDPENTVQKPTIQIYHGEDEDAKIERLKAIKEKEIAEEKRFKAFISNKNYLKKKENERIKAREKQNAKERKKNVILKIKREDFLKRLKRIQKIRSHQ